MWSYKFCVHLLCKQLYFRVFKSCVEKYKRNFWIYVMHKVRKNRAVFSTAETNIHISVEMVVPFTNPILAHVYLRR